MWNFFFSHHNNYTELKCTCTKNITLISRDWNFQKGECYLFGSILFNQSRRIWLNSNQVNVPGLLVTDQREFRVGDGKVCAGDKLLARWLCAARDFTSRVLEVDFSWGIYWVLETKIPNVSVSLGGKVLLKLGLTIHPFLTQCYVYKKHFNKQKIGELDNWRLQIGLILYQRP